MSKRANSEPQTLPPGFRLQHTLRGHEDVITQIVWSPKGTKLASASMDKNVYIWDGKTGELQQIIKGNGPAFGVAWSPDGQAIATAFGDNEVHVWHPETGRLIRTIGKQEYQESSSPADLLHADISRLVGRDVITIASTSNKEELERGYQAYSVAWSPNRQILVSGHFSRSFYLWNVNTGRKLRRPKYEAKSRGKTDIIKLAKHQVENYFETAHIGTVIINSSIFYPSLTYPQSQFQPFFDLDRMKYINCLIWSLDGQKFAFTSGDSKLRIEDAEFEGISEDLEHTSVVLSMSWSPDGKILSSSCSDGTIQLWDWATKQPMRILEGHVDAVTGTSFFSDGTILASKSLDDTIRVWRCDNWETVAILPEPASKKWPTSLAFHPKAPILATLGEKDTIIRIWELDVPTVLSVTSVNPSVHYTNAKVVLVGDTGVGKSGLAQTLTDQPFTPTESTHGRHVWTFDKYGSVTEEGYAETRETMLWDLAGQPGYRLIHQLHLNEVAVALVVFDVRSETDPFTGVHHWVRALHQAQRIQGTVAPPLKKFLVAARADRGGVGVSRHRINALVESLGLDGYLETSAKEGWGITDLAQMVREAIDWKAFPRVSSTKLFKQIKDFLTAEKEAGRLLPTVDDLYHTFLKSEHAPAETEALRAQFEVCIGRVESRGLIRRLGFGNLVLLQPELLDAYASAIINAAKDEPDGLGSMAEEDVRMGRFRMPEDERIKDKGLEELLLIATVEDLLYHEIALREQANEGPYLVFPSQLTREYPDLPDPAGKTVSFQFEGPVMNIYATLAVRLSHSGLFKKKEMWKNAVSYVAITGGTCGVFLREIEEGRGELTLFRESPTSDEIYLLFEEYIQIHLQRRALPESIRRRLIIVCSGCGFVVPDQLIQLLADRELDGFSCPVCKTWVSLVDYRAPTVVTQETAISEMDALADTERERNAVISILQGKVAIGDFDVFLCHSSEDKPVVKKVGEQLKEFGILPWLDEWELRPGLPWQRTLEKQIKNIKAVAVFVGENGLGPWQDAELAAFLRQFVRRECPVIPVILPECKETPELPIFLEGMTWVDFRNQDPDPLRRLIWGITGERE